MVPLRKAAVRAPDFENIDDEELGVIEQAMLASQGGFSSKREPCMSLSGQKPQACGLAKLQNTDCFSKRSSSDKHEDPTAQSSPASGDTTWQESPSSNRRPQANPLANNSFAFLNQLSNRPSHGALMKVDKPLDGELNLTRGDLAAARSSQSTTSSCSVALDEENTFEMKTTGSRRPDADWGRVVKKSRRQLPRWASAPCSLLDVIEPPVRCQLPPLQFTGAITYSTLGQEAEDAARDLRRSAAEGQEGGACQGGQEPCLGFDIEWTVSFQRGAVPHPAAVLQLCGHSRRCHVIHICHSGIPALLREILEDPGVRKAGVGSAGDACKLQRDYGVEVRGVVELGALANQKLAPGRRGRTWGLATLAEELLGRQVAKPQAVRVGDWERRPLGEAQLRYAATDAFAGLRLHQVLTSMPDPPAPSPAYQNQLQGLVPTGATPSAAGHSGVESSPANPNTTDSSGLN